MTDVRSKIGGAYIPPAKLRLMQEKIQDKNSEQYQRLAWEGLKKSINGLINKVNIGNISQMVQELFQINLIRGRGLFCKSLMRAQTNSPTFTHVYAALVAVCNTKFPKVGELLIKRLIVKFRRTFQRNDKCTCINTLKFIAHLFNQEIIYEVLPLEILILLLNNATNDSVEIAIGFLKECGAKLEILSKRGIRLVFESLRNILQDSTVDKRVQYMIEVIFVIRKDNYKDHQPVVQELDLVEEEDQFTHTLALDDDYDTEDLSNIFRKDDNYQENEDKYKAIKQSILGDDDDDDSESGEGSGSDSGEESDDEEDGDMSQQQGPSGDNKQVIIDGTEANLVSLRKIIYLTITSSLDFEECAHKLLKLQIKPSQIPELCNMILDCCSMGRSYTKFYGLLAQRFCNLNVIYVDAYKDIFVNCYTNVHRLESFKIRNCATFFAHLLSTDAIPWEILSLIKLNEDDTNSSNRVFIKYLMENLTQAMGLQKLLTKIRDPDLRFAFDGMFPRDNPKNTRFAINFFTLIQLGALTDGLREALKTMPAQAENDLIKLVEKLKADVSDDSDSSSSSSSSSSSFSSSSSSSSSDSERCRRKRRKTSQKEGREKKKRFL